MNHILTFPIGLLSFAKYVIFPVWHLKGKGDFVIKREAEHGGDLVFPEYQQLEDTFAQKKLHPVDLKNGISAAINELLAPIRASFKASPELQKLTAEAYPVNIPKFDVTLEDEFSKVDLRVGKIVEVQQHPDAEALLVCKIDLAEEQPR